MIRSELVQMLADENPDLALRDVEAIVSTFFDEITARLADDGPVELRGFGSFSTRARDQRPGRTPRPGKPRDSPSNTLQFFQPASRLHSRPHLYWDASTFDPTPKPHPT